MSITSVLGHMMELEFDAAFKQWSGCKPEDLFTAPVKKDASQYLEMIYFHKRLMILQFNRLEKTWRT